ncbi:unnamed protein product [Larinioides sclopetarius]|uniref:Uncharacterized protein n=1 Tax=Larinioides sclopetarius TaxID=280406 RepID=A0AAV2ARM4_9ARAC
MDSCVIKWIQKNTPILILHIQNISSESDEDISLDDARDWCRLDKDNLGPPHPRFPFTGNPGIKVQIYNSTPLGYFGIFF